MQKVCVIGSGYVGLVAGACFSDSGNEVICVDINHEKIKNLNNGIIPIYEPGLEKLIKKNVEENRLFFSTDINSSVKKSEICFIAVGTPPGEDGSADLQYVLSAARMIGSVIENYMVIVDKSTVPVGTADRVKETIQTELDRRNQKIEFAVVSNPEFLREGAAIEDFMKPDRVIIGSDDDRAIKVMQKLYRPFVHNNNPIMVMDTKSAELTKYAANSMLALRISFMNEIAEICERVGANVDNVRRGIGSDFRIGKHFLYSGIGYGGSCFPKDVKAIIKTAKDYKHDFQILNAVESVNARQKEKLFNEVNSYYSGNIKGKKFAFWGLSFKANTDDMREASSIVIIELLLKAGAKVAAFDPEAINEAKKVFGERIEYKKHHYDCLPADALIIATEWNEFRNPDFKRIKENLNDSAIFDGRNLYDLQTMEEFAFNYISIGRQKILKNK
ncbi:MAG: UDP-glucose/GDP-mannose dehydrogenase family protein [Calditrichaeota bacterium]|nr:UDP-glucose/GDP-mannose dehydrogenase family protein [Calditrichota bacterium]